MRHHRVGTIIDRHHLDTTRLLDVAFEQAQKSFAEGGIPIGAALIGAAGEVLGKGHNRRVQENDPSIHGETDAFRKAGRQKSYRHCTMVTTLAPCWYCCGLIKQFGIGQVIIGEATTFSGGLAWLEEQGVKISVLNDSRCRSIMEEFIQRYPEIWNEDIGEE